MCDVIKMRLKRRNATRSRKEIQPLNIKTAVKWLILKLGLPNFRWSFYFILLITASLHFSVFLYDVTYATFQSLSVEELMNSVLIILGWELDRKAVVLAVSQGIFH